MPLLGNEVEARCSFDGQVRDDEDLREIAQEMLLNVVGLMSVTLTTSQELSVTYRRLDGEDGPRVARVQ